MQRRSFLQTAPLAALATSFNLEALLAQGSQNGSHAVTGLELLGKPYNSQVAQITYNTAVEGAQPPTPNGLLFYDDAKKQFFSPVDIVPEEKKGTYSVTSKLLSFNLAKDQLAIAHRSASIVQLGLNFTAPLTSEGDNFAWILKNAVNIFMGSSSSVSGAFAQFQKDNPQTSTPPQTAAPTSTVQVLQGSFDLSVNAFFQKKQGFWSKLFQGISGVPGSPLIATLGIPGIALEGLSFLTYAINKLTQNEGLIPIWNPQPLSFALCDGVKKDFGFKKGHWCIVDSVYMKSSNLLEGHTLDIAGESYQVLNKAGQQINANCAVAQFDVKSI